MSKGTCLISHRGSIKLTRRYNDSVPIENELRAILKKVDIEADITETDKYELNSYGRLENVNIYSIVKNDIFYFGKVETAKEKLAFEKYTKFRDLLKSNGFKVREA